MSHPAITIKSKRTRGLIAIFRHRYNNALGPSNLWRKILSPVYHVATNSLSPCSGYYWALSSSIPRTQLFHAKYFPTFLFYRILGSSMVQGRKRNRVLILPPEYALVRVANASRSMRSTRFTTDRLGCCDMVPGDLRKSPVPTTSSSLPICRNGKLSLTPRLETITLSLVSWN